MASDRKARQALARDIHNAGSKDPETIADYLLRQGWIRKDEMIPTVVNSPHRAPIHLESNRRIMQVDQPRISDVINNQIRQAHRSI